MPPDLKTGNKEFAGFGRAVQGWTRISNREVRDMHWMKRLMIALVGVGLVILSGCVSVSTPPGGGVAPPNEETPKPPQYGTLSGTVLDADSGLKIWDGTVQVGDRTVALRDGVFQVDKLPQGKYTLTISRKHYQIYRADVVVGQGSNYVQVKLRTKYSKGELDLLARLVTAEAGGEPYRGQVAVAASVLNRVESSRYPNTISGVINQVVDGRYYQYEPVQNGSIWKPASSSAWNAVYDALAGWDPSLGATGFYNPAKTSNRWVRQQPVTVTIGRHVFFR